MKRCNACGEEFEDKFSFCPVDATPLNNLTAAVFAGSQRTGVRGQRTEVRNRNSVDSDSLAGQGKPLRETLSAAASGCREFRLTMIDSASLLDRLSRELRFLGWQLRQAWPALKRDPFGFTRAAVVASTLRLRRALAAPNSLAAMTTAMLVMITAVLLLVWSDKRARPADSARSDNTELENVVALTFPVLDPAPKDPGVGAGSEGRVGFSRGKGEGSAAEHRRSTGGGSGGLRVPLPAQVGKVPQPSEIPAPIPKLPPAKNPTLPVAGIDIDPALWKNLPMSVYGDPRSTSTAPSNGPGNGGGMGTDNGTGIGDGRGPGFGPGQDGNTGGDRKGFGDGGTGGSHGNNPYGSEHVYPALQVSERARVMVKPEPQYTEEARKNGITGAVILRVVFSRTGEVTNIRALQSLPFGLTEKAIMAARLIRFRPATKDGNPVNVSMQLEYNFNLY